MTEPAWYDEAARCYECERLLDATTPHHGRYCSSCLPPPYTATDRLRWIRVTTGLSMQESLQVLIDSASSHGHTLCTSDARPIPQSSYRRYMGDPSGTQS